MLCTASKNRPSSQLQHAGQHMTSTQALGKEGMEYQEYIHSDKQVSFSLVSM